MPTSDSLRIALAQVKRIRRANKIAKEIAHGGWGEKAKEDYLNEYGEELRTRKK